MTGTNPISPEDWLKHFSKLLFHEKQDRSSQLEEKINEMLSRNTFSDLDFRITKDEIKKAISSLKSGKGTGLQLISTEGGQVDIDSDTCIRSPIRKTRLLY